MKLRILIGPWQFTLRLPDPTAGSPDWPSFARKRQSFASPLTFLQRLPGA